ncbi:MAG: endonuclease/exonuclease/phosphatase family protein [Puniceicoccales bacterium]|nr:endonuclease/exonuclease/phosphatase family protein [Puniceicoccales bacterium]
MASYNIRYDSPDDAKKGNGWQQRHGAIARMILFHDFDIIGTQEGLHHQLLDLQKKLPGYAFAGKGRDDGKSKGEHTAIFFKKSRYELVAEDTFWLSEDTTQPNKGWDAALPRVCTWIELREITSQKRFFVFNTHFDHRGAKARQESARLILKKIPEIAGTNPAILMGDFNFDQNNESYALLQKSGLVGDAYTLAETTYAENGTFNNFDINQKNDHRIDHIFLTNRFKVKKYGVLTDVYWSPGNADGNQASRVRIPSDHYPVNVVAVPVN